MNALLLENIHSEATTILTEEKIESKCYKKALTSDELKQELKSHQVNLLGIRSTTKLTEELLKTSNHLKAIGHFCIGVDQTDLVAAAHLGIAVFNSPYSSTRSVAEMVIANIINLSRRVGDNLVAMKNNTWQKSAESCHEIRDKTTFVVGLGNIGTSVSLLCEALGMKVIFYDIVPKLAYGNAKAVSTLEEGLRICDYCTLHVPLTPQTENMIDEKKLSLMKDGSYLLNSSRGNVVVIPDVIKALKCGKLSGFFADVYPFEPTSNGTWCNDSSSAIQANLLELKDMKNVILSPHVCGSTIQSQIAIAKDVSSKLIAYLKRGCTIGSVNVPQLDLPLLKENCFRILNFHRNLPGTIGGINKCIESHNVVQLRLETKDDIGYCILDVEKDKSVTPGEKEEIIKRINSLPNSLRTMILN